MGGDWFDVFTSDLDGGRLTRLTNCANAAYDPNSEHDDCDFYWPVLSPDGTTVAAEHRKPFITLIDTATTEQRTLVRDVHHRAYFPAWHPDGEHILYTRDTNDLQVEGFGDEDLYSLPTSGTGPSDGTDATPIITGPGDQEEGDYSPDGTKIVYNGNADDADTYGIWTADSDGTNRRRFDLGVGLNDGIAFDAHFSPDGSRIAFVGRPAGSGNLNLYVIDADGENLRAIATDGDYYYPTWTPDGKILVNGYNATTEGIGLIDPDAANPTYTKLVNPPYPDFSPYPDTYGYPEDIGSTRKPSTILESDDQAPILRLDGPLADYDGLTVTEDSYALTASAVDTDDEVFGSGVSNIKVYLDGVLKQTTQASCDPGECELSRVFTWDTTVAENGIHTIRVTATDDAGNVETDTIAVSLRRPVSQAPRSTSQAAVTVSGAAPGDQAGASVATIGDITADGLSDYAVGAPNARGATTRLNAGAVYIVQGRSAESTQIDLANPGASVTTITGPATNAYCGSSVADAGDVNGDGISDLLVGCPGMDSRAIALSQQGRAYVVFGSAQPANIDLASLGNRGFAISGPTNAYVLGVPYVLSRPSVFGENLRGSTEDAQAVSQDVNGDGLGDIVIGDSAVNNAAGATYVVYGKTDSAPVDVNSLGTRGFVITGTASDALSGYGTAIVGDVTGDGRADVAVGAPGRGLSPTSAAYLVPGRQSSATVNLASPPSGVITLKSGSSLPRFGVDVATLGDTDLDGKPDFAVAASSGAFVVRNLPSDGAQLNLTNGYSVSGPTNDPLLDARVPTAKINAAGDVNDDGRGDLLIGYPDASGPGQGYVVHSPEFNRTHSGGQGPDGSSDGARWPWSAAVIVSSR